MSLMSRIRPIATALALLMAVLVVPVTAAAPASASTAYSATVNSPAGPATNFSGSSGVDTWNTVSDGTNVYGISHVGVGNSTPGLLMTCNTIATGSTCAGFPEISTDYPLWTTKPTPIAYGGKLYTFVTSGTVSGSGTLGSYGVLEMDPSKAGTPDFFGTYTSMFSDNARPITGSATYLVGTRLYSMASVRGQLQAADQLMMCFDLVSTGCNGQQRGTFTVVPSATAAGNGYAGSWIVGSRIYVPWGSAMACFDTTTNAPCAGSWPVSGSATSIHGLLDPATGAPTGVCLSTRTGPWTCLNNDGTSTTVPSGFASAFPVGVYGEYDNFTYSYIDSPLLIGTREYAIAWTDYVTESVGGTTPLGKVACFDFATSAACPGFPSPLYTVGSGVYLNSSTVTTNTSTLMLVPYELSQDPLSPSCLWVNGDHGGAQIQTVDAYSGGPCGANGTRVMVSQFTAGTCIPDAYTSLTVTDSASAWTTGTVQFTDANGVNAGSPLTLTPSGSSATVDLTGISSTLTALTAQAPQVVIQLKNGGTTLNDPISTDLAWTSAGTCGSSPAPMTLTAIGPTSGTAAGGTSVTITGTGFVNGATVTVGGAACANVVVVSATSITCTTPAGTAGAQDVVVTNPDSQSASLTGGYTYVTPPTVCSLTWTSRSSAADNDWRSVTHGNGLFVAVSASGTNRVMTSPDGITWTAQTTPTDAVTPSVYDWKSVTFAKDPSSSDSAVQSGLFVAVGSRVVSSVTKGGVMTSPDGVNWTLRTTAIEQGLTSVTYGNGLFVAVSNTVAQVGSNRVMTSPDGVTWSAVAGINKVWNSVTFAKDPSNAAVSGGLFVAVASSASGNSVMTSPDGSTWTQRSSGLGLQDRSWNSVTYGNGLFVALAASGIADVAMTSPDGVTWSLRTTPSQTWVSITFGGGQFVAVALSGTGNRVMTSTNGIDWTSGTSAADNSWFGVTYGAGGFVAVSRTGTGNRVMTADCAAPADFTVTAGTSTGGTTTATDVDADGMWDLVATPSAGYAFSGWSCDNGQTPASTSSATTTITPTADTTCTATYTAAPALTVVSPSSGTTVGGTSITLTGTGFVAGATVTVGGAACTNVVVVSATSITCTTPAGSAGAKDVVVTNPDSQSATKAGSYTYVAPPTLTQVGPTSGTTAGGTSVTLTGTGFVNGATVTVGGAACTNVVVLSATSITCTTPAGSAGAKDVVVTNPDSQTGTKAGGYTYVTPAVAPTVTAVGPTSGTTAGGTSITLTGTGFVNGATVTIGGKACTNVVVVSATQITCTTPSGTAGAKDGVVRNPDTQVGTLTGGYNYVSATSVTYYGTKKLLTGDPLTLAYKISPSSCTGAVTYSLDRNPLTGVVVAYPLTGPTVDTAGWLPATYTVTVAYPGGSGCTAAMGTGSIYVAQTAEVEGFGYYTSPVGKAKFDFEIEDPNEHYGNPEPSRFSWQVDSKWKVTGVLSMAWTKTAGVGSTTGTGTVWKWVVSGKSGKWVQQGTNVPLTIWFTPTVAKKGSTPAVPGTFALNAAGYPAFSSSTRANLTGGSIKYEIETNYSVPV